MNDLNLCQFIGRLGQDPDVKYTASGEAVATLNIAVGSKWKDQQGQLQERTEWVRITAFKRLAEIMGEHLRKGSQVYISGRWRTQKWTDQQGQDRYTTEVVAQNMQMLGSKPEGQQSQPSQRPAGKPQNGYRDAQNGQQPRQPNPEPDFDFDDDIPFMDTMGRFLWRVV